MVYNENSKLNLFKKISFVYQVTWFIITLIKVIVVVIKANILENLDQKLLVSKFIKDVERN